MHVHTRTHAQPVQAQHDCWWLGSSVLQFSLVPQNAPVIFPPPFFFQFLVPLFFRSLKLSCHNVSWLPDFRIYFNFQAFARTQALVICKPRPKPYNQFFGWFSFSPACSFQPIFEHPCIMVFGLPLPVAPATPRLRKVK